MAVPMAALTISYSVFVNAWDKPTNKERVRIALIIFMMQSVSPSGDALYIYTFLQVSEI